MPWAVTKGLPAEPRALEQEPLVLQVLVWLSCVPKCTKRNSPGRGQWLQAAGPAQAWLLGLGQAMLIPKREKEQSQSDSSTETTPDRQQRTLLVSPKWFQTPQRTLTGFKPSSCPSASPGRQQDHSSPYLGHGHIPYPDQIGSSLCCASSLLLFTLSWCEEGEQILSLAWAGRGKQKTEVQTSHLQNGIYWWEQN